MLKKKYRTTPLYLPGERPPLKVVEGELKKPTGTRNFRVFVLLFKTLFKLFKLMMKRQATPQVKGALWRVFFEKMGGLWVKIGQIMASRSDVFGKEFTKELGKLQDRAPVYPFEYVKKTLEDSLGKPIFSVFAYFEEKPLAAASLAQVHKARFLHNGQLVAVKIQKPFTKEYLEYDLKIIKMVLKFFGNMAIYKHLQLLEIAWEMEIMFREETDFRYEANNLKRAKKAFKLQGFYVPKVYKKYSSDRVVVMEFIQGVTMSKVIEARLHDERRLKIWFKKNKIKPKKVGGKLALGVWRQIFEDNYFHGDLQPGNIMLLAKNRVALIDLGSVGSTDEKILTLYREQLFAFTEKNYSKAAELLLGMTPDIPAENFEAIKKSIIKAFRDGELKSSILQDQGVGERGSVFAQADNEVQKEFLKHKMAYNWSLLKLSRSFVTLDASLVTLMPKLDFMDEFSKFYVDYKQRRLMKRIMQLGELPENIAKFGSLISSVQRFKTFSFKSVRHKIGEAISFLLQPIKWIFLAGLFTLIWTYLFQHHDIVDDFHENRNFFTEFVESVPQFSTIIWILWIYIGYRMVKWVRTFSKEIKDPIKKFQL